MPVFERQILSPPRVCSHWLPSPACSWPQLPLPASLGGGAGGAPLCLELGNQPRRSTRFQFRSFSCASLTSDNSFPSSWLLLLESGRIQLTLKQHGSLGHPPPCAVKNPHIPFDSPRTQLQLSLGFCGGLVLGAPTADTQICGCSSSYAKWR